MESDGRHDAPTVPGADGQCSEPAGLPTRHQLIDQFDTSRAQQHVLTLSSEAFAGRRVGTARHDTAQAWLAEQFGALGLETTIFPFALDVPVLDLYQLPTLTILDPVGTVPRTLQHRTEFTPHPRSVDRPLPITGIAVHADLDVDRGIHQGGALTELPPIKLSVPNAGTDAARGAWLILDAVPRGEALTTVAAAWAADGGIGILVPQLPNTDGYLVKRITGQSPVALPAISVRADLLAALDGQTITATTPIRPTRADGGHVLAMLPGTDPTLAAAPLIVSAHYDGLGDDGPPGSGGDRLPCATDNAAGVAVILELARVLAGIATRGARPSRSILFAALDAEEVNAIGSRAYASALHSRGMIPLVMNLDGAARWHGQITLDLGPGTQSLIPALDEAGADLKIPLVVGSITSDNRRFAAAGFPAIGVSVGLSGMHTPADRADQVEPEAMRRVGTWLLATIWRLAFMERQK